MDKSQKQIIFSRRSILPVILFILVLCAVPALPFQFIVAGDSRNDTNGILPKIVKAAIATPHLSGFIYLGDMTATGSTAEFAHYKQTMKPLKVPLYSVPGNHERGTGDNYEKLIGPAYYSKQVGKWRFVFIDNSKSSLGDAQWAWIGKELADAQAKKDYIVLAMHEPLWCPIAGDHVMAEPDRGKLLELAEKSGVKLVLAAHYHSFYKGTHNGILHLTTGGAGAPLYGPIAFYHYCLADFKNDGTFEVKAIRVK